MDKSSRREFIVGTAGLAGAALLPRTASAAQDISVLPGYAPKVTGYWVGKGDHEKSLALARKMIDATTDFSWLSRGDRVLVKLALNSGNPYPRTTDPWLLDAVIRILNEKGARVVVGDSAGCGHVRWTPTEKKGSSRALCQNAGLLPIIDQHGAAAVFFEEQDYDSFLETAPSGAGHWTKPMRIASVVKDVEHIVYLPRVSSHVLADFTAGLKVGIGFLREDSRLAAHSGGGDYAAMFEEVNHVPEIEGKVRLVVSSGRMVPTLIGPDVGPVATPDHGLFFASTDLLAHDLLAYAWVKWAREFMTSPDEHAKDGAVAKAGAARNKGFLKTMWKLPDDAAIPDLVYFQAGDTGTIYDHPVMVSFMKRKGGRPEKVHFEELTLNPSPAVADYLKREIRA
jgi:uncharacterized protein (DUF362 family)